MLLAPPSTYQGAEALVPKCPAVTSCATPTSYKGTPQRPEQCRHLDPNRRTTNRSTLVRALPKQPHPIHTRASLHHHIPLPSFFTNRPSVVTLHASDAVEKTLITRFATTLLFKRIITPHPSPGAIGDTSVPITLMPFWFFVETNETSPSHSPEMAENIP